jgi:hypothetical protein
MKQLTIQLMCVAIFGFGAGCTKKENTVVAKIGRFELTAQDVDRRNEIEKIYNSKVAKPIGLSKLVRAYEQTEILASLGILFPDAALKAEAARMDRETAVPESLNRIKNIFGTDINGYYRVFVQPILTERVIYYEYFLKKQTNNNC